MGVSKPYHSNEQKEKYDKEYERIFGQKEPEATKKAKVKDKVKK
jgi:hypothetical protein